MMMVGIVNNKDQPQGSATSLTMMNSNHKDTIHPPLVVVAMGSDSDFPIMRHALEKLQSFGVPAEARIISAHRTPERLRDFAHHAANDGVKIIIAGAGGAAHLAGMLASFCTLPVLGVPIPTASLQGLDSLLSTVQMPRGVPVASFAIGESGAINAALFAVAILSLEDKTLAERWAAFRQQQTDLVRHQPTDAEHTDSNRKEKASTHGHNSTHPPKKIK